MPVPLHAGSLALVLAACGLGGMGLSEGLSARRLSAGERLGFAALWGPILTAILTLALAQAGRFSLHALLALSLAWALGGSLFGWRRRRPPPGVAPGGPSLRFLACLALPLAAAAVLIAPPNTYLGGWDTGAYVNIATEIGRSGRLDVADPLLAELAPEERPAFMHKPDPPRRNWHVGYQVVDEDRGRLRPDFYHLYPAWLAAWSAAGGQPGLRAGHGVLALLALLMIAMAGETLAGARPAFLGLSLFLLCGIQAYVMKTTMAELFTQFALFAGLWAAARMLREPLPDPGSALAAGAAWSAALLAHATALLPVGVGLVFLFYVVARERVDLRGPVLLAAFLCALAIAWNVARSAELTAFVWERVASNRAWWAGGAALLLLVPAALRIRNPHLPCALLAGALAAGLWVRPRWFPGSEANNARIFCELLGWGGVVGVFLFAWRRRVVGWPAGVRLLLAMAAVSAGVLMIDKRASPFYLWAARRWVEFALPAGFLVGAAGLARLAGAGCAGRLASLALVLGWALSLFPLARLVYGTPEYGDSPAAFGRVAEAVRDADAVLSDRWDVPVVLRYTHGIPAWGLGRAEGGEGIRDGQLAARLMRKWVRGGKRVYWIGRAFVDPELRFTPVARLEAEGRVLELSPDRLPARVVPDPLDEPVHRVTAGEGPLPDRIDIGLSPMGLGDGFSRPKRTLDSGGNLMDYRTVKASASLTVPVRPGPWRIRMARTGAGGDAAEVAIRLDGRVVETFRVDREWSDYRFPGPQGPAATAVCTIEVRGPAGKGAVGIDRLEPADDSQNLETVP